MVCMFILTPIIIEDVIYEDYNEHVQVLLQSLFIKFIKDAGAFVSIEAITINSK